MSVLSKCQVIVRHVSKSEREIAIEIPPAVMRQAIQAYHQKTNTDKDRGLQLNKKAPHISSEEYQGKMKPMAITITECFEEFLKNYPEKMIGRPFMKVKTTDNDSLVAMIHFRVANKSIRLKKPLKVTKEKFCQAYVDKDIKHAIEKHREAIAVCTPIEDDRPLRVNESIVIDCEIAHHLENVLEVISGLSFDLIEESPSDQKDSQQKPSKKLKATHEALDRMSMSTLRFSYLLDAIQDNEDFFHVKVGETKKKKLLADDEVVTTIIIHVRKMYKKKLPPIDHKFAKSMGFSSIQQMKKKLKQKYTDLEEERIQTLLYNDTLKEYIKQNPPGLLSRSLFLLGKKFFFKGTETLIEKSGIASKKLIDQKMNQWKKNGYIEKETEGAFKEITTIVNLAKKWGLIETIAEEFKRTVIYTPGLYEKLKAELPPEEEMKGGPNIHPMAFDIMKKIVIEELLSETTVTEIEPTDRDEREYEQLPEAVEATQSTTLTDAESLRSTL